MWKRHGGWISFFFFCNYVDEFLDSYSLVYGGGWVFYVVFAVDYVSAIVFVKVANISSIIVAVVYTTIKSPSEIHHDIFKKID